MIYKKHNQIVLILIPFLFLESCDGTLKGKNDTPAEFNEAEQIVSRQVVQFNKPPQKIPVPHSIDAPMMGNGFTGIALSGNPEKQVYYLARNDFWRLKSSLNESFPAVLGKLEISLPGMEEASYLVNQNLYKAKTEAIFSKDDRTVSIKSYISAVEDLMIIEINIQGEGELSGNINLELPGDNEFLNKPPGDRIFPSETTKQSSDEGVYSISREFKKDVDIPTKAAVASTVLGSNSSDFKLTEGDPVFIAVSFSSNFKNEDCLDVVQQRLTKLQPNDLSSIEEKHKAWWADFWSRSYVDIADSLIEKQYYLSNYSMACFSRDKDFPPSIFGTCITKERPYWNGDYHLNYNHMAPYYGLFSSNHAEQAIPCNMAILAFQERGNYYCKKITGIEDGLIVPVGIGPLGIETTRRNEFVDKHRKNWIEDGSIEDEGLFFGQKSNSAYCVVNMSSHFYTTYDEEYTALYYPFVKGVAAFWEKYLVWEDDRYVIYNDAIHEGTIGTVNPILSLGLIPLSLQTAIDMSIELGVDEQRREKWNYLIEHLSDYTYQEKEGKTVFRYSEKGTAWWRDNTLGIQHIYPGSQVGLDSDPELLQVAYNTIEVMNRWIDFNGSNSFFPAAVRVGYNADTILANMHKYVQHTYPNGFQLDNPHGIENFSTVPNTINEMLCMGHGGILRVFPVWPKNKDAHFHNIRIHGAFLVSSEIKDGSVVFVNIVSEKGKTCQVKNPWPGQKIGLARNDGDVEHIEGDLLNIATTIGETLKLQAL